MAFIECLYDTRKGFSGVLIVDGGREPVDFDHTGKPVWAYIDLGKLPNLTTEQMAMALGAAKDTNAELEYWDCIMNKEKIGRRTG